MISESNQEAWIKLVCDTIKQRYGIEVAPQMVSNALELLITIYQHLNSLPENLVKEYFRHAEIDYESAKLLYDNKIYPSMAFHIQQTVEKLAKAYALYLGVVKNNELYPKYPQGGIGHESPKAFILILNKKGAMDLICLLSTILSQRQKTYEIIRKDIEDFERLLGRKKELAKMSKVEIQSLVLEGEGIINKLGKIDPRKVIAEVKRARLGFDVRARRMGLPVDDTAQKLFLIFSDPNTQGQIFDKLILFAKLYILTIITFPHSSYPRYPHGDIQITDYQEGLGIVDYAKELSAL